MSKLENFETFLEQKMFFMIRWV